ncbi:MAG TPA: hypothetical protein PK971_13080 [Saprospiraceae bacterium]|nr:hypothetical protein [Saprospiraceae bacterium]HND89261.1 hypothetical protein [Saprospiraceae bacterium]HNG89945.1 hypothetical protein [Saprospiraceae bacterium]
MHYLFFSLHLAVTLLAWVAPFLISWTWLLPIYAAVMLQFAVFGRCLMNERHGLQETDDRIFYTDLLEMLGFRLDRRRVKYWVRGWLYPTLAVVALIWQLGLGQHPLLF